MSLNYYFDNSATSFPKPDCVCDSVYDYMKNQGASPSRGTYKKSRDADMLLYKARKSVTKLINAKKTTEIIFTQNATEAINLAVFGYVKEGFHIMTTSFEHNAVWRTLNAVAEEKNCVLHTIKCDDCGNIDFEDVKQLLSQGIDFAVFTHGSNVIGNIVPIKELSSLCHEHNTPVLVDASQTVGIIPVNVSGWEVEMLAFTGHKGPMGPTGTGVLYLKDGITLTPLKYGGTGSMSSSKYQPDDSPDRYESGTLPMAAIVGLKSGVEFILNEGIQKIHSHELSCIKRLIDGLSSIEGLTIYGEVDSEDRLPLISINSVHFDCYKLAEILDERYSLMSRAGLHCAPQAHRVIGTDQIGTLRFSIGYFTKDKDVDYLISSIRTIMEGK